MVNEMFTHTKHRVKVRPKPVYLWTASDVQNWYRRHCSEYLAYIDNFSKAPFFYHHEIADSIAQCQVREVPLYRNNEITGRTLLRITDHSLLRMGISNYRDREAIWREIVKQRLKTDFMEIRDMELMDSTYT